MSIRLAEITADNWEDVIDLEVFEEQGSFVADNAYSLAEAAYNPHCIPLAIYNGDELVGFMMYHPPYEEDNDYWFFRFMIDKDHQRKGYGKAAMQIILDKIKEDKAHNRVFLSFESENTGAKALYESFGFVPDGRILDNEIVYVLNY